MQDINSAIDELRDIQTEHELLETTLKKLESVRQETVKRAIERDQLTARADVRFASLPLFCTLLSLTLAYSFSFSPNYPYIH